MFSSAIKLLRAEVQNKLCSFTSTIVLHTTICNIHLLLLDIKKKKKNLVENRQMASSQWNRCGSYVFGAGGKHQSSVLSHLHKVPLIITTGILEKMAAIHCRKSILNFEDKSLLFNGDRQYI